MTSNILGSRQREIEIKFDVTPEQLLALAHDPYVGHHVATPHQQLTFYKDFADKNHGTDFTLYSRKACLRTRRISPDARICTGTTFREFQTTVKIEDGILVTQEAESMDRREYDFIANSYWPDIREILKACRREQQQLRIDQNTTCLADYFDALRKPGDIRMIGSLPYQRYDGAIEHEGTHIAFCHDSGFTRTPDFRSEPFHEFELELIPDPINKRPTEGLPIFAKYIQRKYGLEIHTKPKAQRLMEAVLETDNLDSLRITDDRIGIIPPKVALQDGRFTGGTSVRRFGEIYKFLMTGEKPIRTMVLVQTPHVLG